MVLLLTLTVTCSVDAVGHSEFPEKEETVYVVIEVGLAITELPELEFNPKDGDQVYVPSPPLALSVVDYPLHIVTALVFNVTGNKIPEDEFAPIT